MFTPPYRELSRFAGNLAMGVETALNPSKALSLALRSLRGTRIAPLLNDPVKQVQQGASLAQALGSAERKLPPFVLPILRAGEETGRLDEALRFLEHHCNLLAGPARAIRNAWLYPVCIILAAEVINFMLYLGRGSIAEAFGYLLSSVWGWSGTLVIVAIVFLPPLKPYIDRIRLVLPWLGSIERDIANHRFFRILSLMYGVSNSRVDEMITIAAQTVSNLAARQDLLKAATAIRQQQTVAEAFMVPNIILDDEQKASIAGGEIAGKLEEIFDQIANSTGESLEAKLAWFQKISLRVVLAFVVFALIGTVQRLILR